MTQPRLVSETSAFPPIKAGGRVCYIEIAPDGTVTHLRYTDELREGLARARDGTSRVFAAWPGDYRTDLFLVDQ